MVQAKESQRRAQIVQAARELLESEGADALSMRRIADRLGIRAASLYNHLASKQALENALISDGFEEMAATFDRAVAGSTAGDLLVLGRAYRSFAARHPHLYRLMTERELDREGLTPGAEEAAARPLVDALEGDESLARAVFAFMHGMVILELNRRFPTGVDVEAAWRAGLQRLIPDLPNRPSEAQR